MGVFCFYGLDRECGVWSGLISEPVSFGEVGVSSGLRAVFASCLVELGKRALVVSDFGLVLRLVYG